MGKSINFDFDIIETILFVIDKHNKNCSSNIFVIMQKSKIVLNNILKQICLYHSN